LSFGLKKKRRGKKNNGKPKTLKKVYRGDLTELTYPMKILSIWGIGKKKHPG